MPFIDRKVFRSILLRSDSSAEQGEVLQLQSYAAFCAHPDAPLCMLVEVLETCDYEVYGPKPAGWNAAAKFMPFWNV